MKKIIFILSILFCFFTVQAEDMKVGLALSGGGARGLAHIGLLKVIDEIGLEVDYVSGTSFGALVGAMYSLGYSAVEIEAIFMEFDFRSEMNDSISREDLFIEEKRWLDYGVLQINLDDEDLSLSMPMALLSGNRILLKLSEYLNRGVYYENFDEFPIPFRCNGTNLSTGESVTFRDGNIINVVRASMSLPTLLEPFEVDGVVYVDGGVKDNLPVDDLLDMGANYILANNISTPLKKAEDVQSIISVLNQTINLNMNVWIEDSISKSDLVLTPELNKFSNTSFDDVDQIIRLGEENARNNIDELLRLKSLQTGTKKRKSVYTIPDKLLISNITTRGNNTVHRTKIKLYSGLKEGNYYTYDEIIEASKKCYKTNLFTLAYPELVYNNGDYSVNFVIQEKTKGFFAVDVLYDSSNNATARVTTTLNNILQANSKYIASLQLGGINSLVFDYVKNFGDLYGAYYHVSPYIEEMKMYHYNIDGNKSSRTKKLEYGLNLGIGFFLEDILIGEGYVFGFRSLLYQDIAELQLEQTDFKAIGVGIKAYHESLDDLYFPSKGNRVMLSYQKSLDSSWSDESYEKTYFDLLKAIPLNSNFSVQAGTEIGFFRSAELGKIFSPFQIGGIDSFTGMEKHSVNNEAYQINQIGIMYTHKKKYFINLSGQFLYNGDLKVDKDFVTYAKVVDLSLGYKSPIGPLRIAVSHDLKSEINYFISFGFTKDMFKFSRQ